MRRHLPCCIVALAACTRPAPAPPRDPATGTTSSEQPAETAPTSPTPPTPPTPPTTSNTPATAAGGDGAHCLFVEPEHRVVRCYWKREACEEQLAFNRNSKIVASQRCEEFAQAYCFDEAGQREACYPTEGDCEATVAKFRKRNRQVSSCAAKRGP